MKCLQNTERKHDHEHELLLQVHVQLVKLPQRQDQDDDVYDNVEDGAKPSLQVDVVALAMVPLFQLQPGVVDGRALEERGEEE